MIHPDTELRFVNPTIGLGVFATKPIPRGTITWALDALDRAFTEEQQAELPAYARAIMDVYSYRDSSGRFVLCWDHARFINHHCEANCLSVGYEFEIAVRDIAAGEELTDDYGTLNLTEPFPCSCGSSVCRGQALPDDMVRLADRWTAIARDGFFQIPHVAQPLWGVIPQRALVEAALADPTQLRTIHRHYRGETGTSVAR